MNPKIAFFLPNLQGGGAEKVSLNLLGGMKDSYQFKLDLVLGRAEGEFLSEIPDGINVIDLNCRRMAGTVVPFVKYLNANQPNAVLSHISHTNIVALAASFISSSSSKVYIVEHNNLTARQVKLRRAVFVRMLMRLMYPLADKVIGVSDGVSNDIRNVLKLNPSKVKTIFNPVVNSNITTKSREKPNHSWLTRSDVPVFLGIGRFTEQKDFENLLMAFAQLLRMVDARLIILGDGPLRCRLESVITELKLSSFVSLPGFVDNPYSFLSRASCFVLSSKYEGLPTVLIEALACGCDVVATDCPSGPSEILKNGEIGRLVPVEDSESLAAAMYESLKSPTCREKLKLRATAFTPSVVIPQYVSLLTGD